MPSPLRPIALACLFACAGVPSRGPGLRCQRHREPQDLHRHAKAGHGSIINIKNEHQLTDNIGVLPGNATINGNGFSLNGGGQYRAFSSGKGIRRNQQPGNDRAARGRRRWGKADTAAAAVAWERARPSSCAGRAGDS